MDEYKEAKKNKIDVVIDYVQKDLRILYNDTIDPESKRRIMKINANMFTIGSEIEKL